MLSEARNSPPWVEAEGKGGRPAISFSYNIGHAIIVLLPLSSLTTVRVPIAIYLSTG